MISRSDVEVRRGMALPVVRSRSDIGLVAVIVAPVLQPIHSVAAVT
jgi:hypothetical protein